MEILSAKLAALFARGSVDEVPELKELPAPKTPCTPDFEESGSFFDSEKESISEKLLIPKFSRKPRVDTVPEHEVCGSDIGDLPCVYKVVGLKIHEFPVIGTYVSKNVKIGQRYLVRPLGTNTYLFDGVPMTLQSIGMGYGKRITFKGESLLENDNYFYSDTHPQGYGFSLVEDDLKSLIRVDEESEEDEEESIEQKIYGHHSSTIDKDEQLIVHEVQVRGSDIGDLPCTYNVRGLRKGEFPVIGTYVSKHVKAGSRYTVRLLESDTYLFNGEAMMLQSIGMGYGKRITFKGESLLENQNYFYSDSHPQGYGFSLVEERPVILPFEEKIYGEEIINTKIADVHEVNGEDIGDLPCRYQVAGLHNNEFSVIGTYVSKQVRVGLHYRVRLLGSEEYLFDGKPKKLQSIGMGYGKRITFQGESLLENDNYFYSDTYPQGYGFSLA